MTHSIAQTCAVTIGLDLGDQYTHCCVLDESGDVIEESKVRTLPEALSQRFRSLPKTTIAMEAGTHSGWASRLLNGFGHEVIVANPRKLRLIYENNRKDDRVDAQYLARLARTDPKLLAPIRPRSEASHRDLAVLRSRDELVRTRTKLVNHVRGTVKTTGSRLPKGSTASFATGVAEFIPEALRPALMPVLMSIRTLTEQIRQHDRWIERDAVNEYPQCRRLLEVPGVGALTAMAYVLTLDDPKRFKDSRDVGAYLGLCPKRDQSGDDDPQLRITKAGNRLLRRLLVGSAHYILGPFAPDTDLRRWGKKLAERGGKSARKRAVVAVARKLATLLHCLWITQEPYKPLRDAQPVVDRPVPPPPDSLRSSLGAGGGTGLEPSETV